MRRYAILTCLAALGMVLLFPICSPAQPYRVAVLPFTVHSQEDLSYLRDGIRDIISTRVIVEGQIAVVERPLVDRFLTDLRGRETTDREARWLGARVGADYVVYGSITKVGEFISLDAKVVSVAGTRPTTSSFVQHKGIDEVMPKVGTFAQDIANRIMGRSASYERSRGELREYLRYQAVGYTRMKTFPDQKLKGVDVGDVTGDGKNEVVIIGERQIWIYRDEGKTLTQVAQFTEGPSYRFLTVDLFDLDGDEKAEICVTNAREDGDLQSFILAHSDGAFTYLAERLPWYLRVVRVPGKGRVLIGQYIGSDKDFQGAIRIVEWKEKTQSAKLGKKAKLPDFAEWAYEFAIGHLTSPEADEYVVLDITGAARVRDRGGSQLWKSGEKFGTSDNWFDRPELYRDRDGNPSQFARRIYLPPRMVVQDLDGDGLDEVTAVVNKFTGGAHLEHVRIYDKGYVVSLAWDGLGLAEVWRTQDVPGYVADFQIRDCDNDGRDELVVVSFTGGFLKKDTRGSLTVFELYE
jgi:TolB-like protein